MAQEAPNWKVLLLTAKKKELYEKLIVQLNKDFLLANIHSAISKDTAEGDLFVFLKEKLYRLMMEDFNGYLNFMYIVDVPEASFKKISITDAVAVAEQVSFLVLEREFKKVRLREAYANKN